MTMNIMTAEPQSFMVRCPYPDCGYDWVYRPRKLLNNGNIRFFISCPNCRRNLQTKKVIRGPVPTQAPEHTQTTTPTPTPSKGLEPLKEVKRR